MESKKVAIIILNYNDSENTIEYVNKIKKYKILNKIIVVDNNSSKENEFVNLCTLKSSNIEVIKAEKNGGYSYGNNFGIKYLEKINCNIDYIIISNPDVYVEESSIIKCIEFFNENKKAAIVAPRMYYENGQARRSAWKTRKTLVDIANSTRITQLLLFPIFKNGEYSKKDFGKKALKVDNVSGAFFVADYNKFKEINFFDENVFLFYEEDIISKRLIEKGYSIYSLNDIKYIHYDSKTIGKLMSVYKKQDILFDSRIYYQKTYNKIGKIYEFVFNILRYIRKIELVFEVIILKVKRKFK